MKQSKRTEGGEENAAAMQASDYSSLRTSRLAFHVEKQDSFHHKNRGTRTSRIGKDGLGMSLGPRYRSAAPTKALGAHHASQCDPKSVESRVEGVNGGEQSRRGEQQQGTQTELDTLALRIGSSRTLLAATDVERANCRRSTSERPGCSPPRTATPAFRAAVLLATLSEVFGSVRWTPKRPRCVLVVLPSSSGLGEGENKNSFPTGVSSL